MINLREHCASVLLGNTKAGKWNVTKSQKLKAIKFHVRKTDNKKKKINTPVRHAIKSVYVKFLWFQKRNGPTQNQNKFILSHYTQKGILLTKESAQFKDCQILAEHSEL